MIKDTCICGSSFKCRSENSDKIFAASDEQKAHGIWLKAHKPCREIIAPQGEEQS